MRDWLRALLPRLHVLPALSGVTVDLGGASLPLALQHAGPAGDVLVIDDSPDELARLRAACRAPNVYFLLGNADVLPLPDASVDVVLGGDGADVARVLRR